MYIGPYVVVIVIEMKNQLDVTQCFLLHLCVVQ
jgi:hypothetical protein